VMLLKNITVVIIFPSTAIARGLGREFCYGAFAINLMLNAAKYYCYKQTAPIQAKCRERVHRRSFFIQQLTQSQAANRIKR